MHVACVLTASEVSTAEVDLLVFPEGADCNEIEVAKLHHPDSMIVAAVVENNHSRGLLLHNNWNHIEYLKVQTDGRTQGSDDTKQMPIYEHNNTCVGVLICMDIDHIEFSKSVIERVQSSTASLKLLCIPADMGSDWLRGEKLPFPQKFAGIHVILCNHKKTHKARCKSFVTDIHGNKIAIQVNNEPIYAMLP